MSTEELTIKRGAIRPVECFKGGWELIKQDYWYFLGISVVGMLVAGLAPFGLLMGPMMCGIDMCLLRKKRGQSFSFENLFQGFNHFVPSLIPALCMIVPLMVIGGLGYIGVIISAVASMPAPQQRGRPGPPPGVPWAMFIAMGVFFVLIMLTSMLMRALLMFAFPLIVDRKVSGLEAVKLSVKACFANLGGMIGLVMLELLLSLAGALLCCFGSYLVLPIGFAAMITAYQQVFPEAEPMVVMPAHPETGIRGA